MSDRYDIRVEEPHHPYNGMHTVYAIEDQRFDVDGDSEGFYPNYAQASGQGKTYNEAKWEAIRELINKLEEAERNES